MSFQFPVSSFQEKIKKAFISFLLAAGGWQLVATAAHAADDSIFGPIEAPPHVIEYGGGAEGQGLILFLSNLIKLFMIVAGLFAFINLIIAGYIYINGGGNPEEIARATQKINFSLIGLVVVVASFALAGIFGYIIFGDASAILNPKIYGPGV